MTSRPMQARKPEGTEDIEGTADSDFDELFTGPGFEPDAVSGLEEISRPGFELPNIGEISGAQAEDSLEANSLSKTPGQVIFPVGVSIVVHICLLLLLLQLAPDTALLTLAELQPPSIQISFRPRPVPPPESEPEPQTVEQEEPPVPEPLIGEAPLPATEELPTGALADQTVEDIEPPSVAPRLLAPALLDVRDLIQNRAQNDATARIYDNNCDERQRRTDLIDCGDEDPNARYNFAAAEQNNTVEFFSALNPLPEETGNQPDRTGGDARTRASLNNMNGNLGANPLIRSVLGQP